MLTRATQRARTSTTVWDSQVNTSLDLLIFDLLISIAEACDFDTLLTFPQTCRSWQAAIAMANERRLWEPHLQRVYPRALSIMSQFSCPNYLRLKDVFEEQHMAREENLTMRRMPAGSLDEFEFTCRLVNFRSGRVVKSAIAKLSVLPDTFYASLPWQLPGFCLGTVKRQLHAHQLQVHVSRCGVTVPLCYTSSTPKCGALRDNPGSIVLSELCMTNFSMFEESPPDIRPMMGIMLDGDRLTLHFCLAYRNFMPRFSMRQCDLLRYCKYCLPWECPQQREEIVAAAHLSHSGMPPAIIRKSPASGLLAGQTLIFELTSLFPYRACMLTALRRSQVFCSLLSSSSTSPIVGVVWCKRGLAPSCS